MLLLTLFLKRLKENLLEKNSIKLSGFGSFEVKKGQAHW